jgi:2-dehydrotetronate isomerase
MPKFAANLSMLYNELPFLQRFEAAAQDGFKAVEFLSPYSFSASEIAQQLKAHDLQLALFNAPPGGTDSASIEAAWSDSMQRGTACLTGREDECRQGIMLALQYAQALQCPRIHLMAGKMPLGIEREALQPTYLANLHWAAEQARPMGIDILIEPINQRDIPRYFLNRQDHAHEVSLKIGAPNLKIQMDLYHCQIVEGDVATKLRQYLPTGRVGHLQIAGVPERHEPDVGELNYSYLLDLIDKLNYNDWIGCEYRPQRGAVAHGTSDGLTFLR